MIKTRLLTAVVALALTASACVGGSPTTSSAGTSGSTAEPATTGTADSNGAGEIDTATCDSAPDDASIVCEAYDLIQANYVDEVSDQSLVAAGIEGLDAIPTGGPGQSFVCPLPTNEFRQMCEALAGRDAGSAEIAEAIVNGFAMFGLDPNSAYLDQDALALLQETQHGEFEGIGAFVSPEDETIEGDNKQCAIVSDTCRIVIASTIEGTPAEAAGLQPGDVIAGVNGDDIRGWTIDEVTATVRGPAGSDVTLTIERGSETFELTITRADVVIPVMETDRFGDDGYIRLSGFSGTADEQFQSAVIGLIADGIDDLVVDLRNNPGGLLDTAIEITSVFLPSGEVVVTEGPGEEVSYPVTGASLIPEDVNVYFVVNRGSASASEVVSAVLQERDRATVIGENTFGKNTVQQQFGLSNGGALKLTIARWLTPDGLDFGGVGVTPDIEMTFDPEVTAEDLVAMVVGLS